MSRKRSLPLLLLLLCLLVALVSGNIAGAQQNSLSARDIAGLRQGLGGKAAFDRAVVERADIEQNLNSYAAGRAGRPLYLMVELDGAPVAEVTADTTIYQATEYANRLRAEQSAVTRAIEAQTDAKVVGSTRQVFNSLIITLGNAQQLDTIRSIPGVAAVHAPRIISRADVTDSSVTWIGSQAFWEATGLTGKNVSIGIVDSGIDYTHANFGGEGTVAAFEFAFENGTTLPPGVGFPSAKVPVGYDFVGDDYNASDPLADVPVPDPNPMDCDGHGTSAASLAAGYGMNADGTTFTGPWDASLDVSSLKMSPGVAPEAELFALRTFGCVGSTSDIVVIQAMDWAVERGVDVLSLSLGSDFGTPNEAYEEAVRNITNAGVFVVAAAGNAGDVFYITGSPSNASTAISVAASLDPNIFEQIVTVNSPYSARYTGAAQGYGPSLLEVGPITANVVRAVPALGCSALTNAAAIAGNIALIDRGACTGAQKARNAAAAGAAAVILVNNRSGPPVGLADDGGGSPIPALMISQADGAVLKSALLQGPVNVTMGVGNSLEDTIASYTSRGPRAGNVADGVTLKPDITAPAERTFTAAVGTGNEGSLFGGTSAATPHMAGVMALLREKYPDLTTDELKAMAMNTATNDLFTGPGNTGLRHSPGRIGAGRVNMQNILALDGKEVIAYNAARPDLVSVSFGVVEVVNTVTLEREIKLDNFSDEDVTYNVGTDLVLSLPGTNVAVSPSSVTVPAGGSALVTVTLTADKALMNEWHQPDPVIDLFQNGLPRHWLGEVSGFITFSPAGGQLLRVPVYALPRPASEMSAVNDVYTAPLGAVGSTEIDLAGVDVFTGFEIPFINPAATAPTDTASLVTAFILGTSDPSEYGDGPGSNADIQYIGASSDFAANFAATGDVDAALFDTRIFFAITTHQDWNTPGLGDVVFEIYIDVDEDGFPDFILYNINYGRLVLGGSRSSSDVYITHLINTTNFSGPIQDFVNSVPASVADTYPMNNNVMVLPVYAFDLGLSSANPDFDYFVVSYSLDFGYGLTDFAPDDAAVGYNTAAEPVSFTDLSGAAGGPYPGLPVWFDLDGFTVPVDYNLSGLGAADVPDVLLLHHHNVSGMRVEVVDVKPMTLVAPATYEQCSIEPASDTIRVVNVGEFKLQGRVNVFYTTGPSSVELIESYPVNHTGPGDYSLTINYPSVSEWPFRIDPATGAVVGEIHVQVQIEVLDLDGNFIRNLDGSVSTLGPGQDWDVFCLTQPPPKVDVRVRALSVSVPEGTQATNGGTISGPATLTTSLGEVVDNGDGTFSWKYDTTDGPAQSQMVTIYATNAGGTSMAQFELVVNNAAPTATFTAISPIMAGGASTLTFSNADDPSSDDEAAPLVFSYSCTGAEPFLLTGTTSTTFNCPFDTPGTKTVLGRVADKDGGYTDYTAIVQVDPAPEPEIRLTTPVTYELCPAQGASDTVAVTGIGERQLRGQVVVEYVTGPDTRQPVMSYPVNHTGPADFSLVVMYPPVDQWPSFTDPNTGAPVREIHVTVQIEVLDAAGDFLMTLGPGQNWDVFCLAAPPEEPQPVNNPPVANPVSLTTDKNVPITFNLAANASDPDGDPLTLSFVQPVNGTAAVNPDMTITYTPNPDYFGPDSFMYSVDDGRGGTASALVSIMVNDVVVPPPPPPPDDDDPEPPTPEPQLTLTTPATYSACPVETTSDVVTVTGIGDRRLRGYIIVEYVTEAGRELIAVYLVNHSGPADFSQVVEYPPVTEWPFWINPITGAPVGEIHVDIRIEVLDAQGNYIRTQDGSVLTLGPGQDWDVFCLTPPEPRDI